MILPSHHPNCFIFIFKIILGFVMLNCLLEDEFQYYFLCSNCDHIQRTPTQIRCANANFLIIPCTIVCKFNSHSILKHCSTREVCNSEIDLVWTNCDAHRLFRLNISLIFFVNLNIVEIVVFSCQSIPLNFIVIILKRKRFFSEIFIFRTNRSVQVEQTQFSLYSNMNREFIEKHLKRSIFNSRFE